MTTPIVLPWPLKSSLEATARALLKPIDQYDIDFSRPIGEAALVPPDSLSWRVFKNPLSLFIGGVTAVILELAEPRVRTGVWEAGHVKGRLSVRAVYGCARQEMPVAHLLRTLCLEYPRSRDS